MASTYARRYRRAISGARPRRAVTVRDHLGAGSDMLAQALA
jgi:hypothetical protein